MREVCHRSKRNKQGFSFCLGTFKHSLQKSNWKIAENMKLSFMFCQAMVMSWIQNVTIFSGNRLDCFVDVF